MTKSMVDGHKELIDKDTGQIITVQSIIKKVSGNYFWKVKMMDFLNSINVVGDKSMRVYSFILGHINQRTNKLKMSNEQIQIGLKKEYKKNHQKNKNSKNNNNISLTTISLAISKLRHIKISKNNKPLLMRKRYGKYGRKSYLMINPAMLMRGSEGKRQGLLIQYDNVDKDKRVAKKRYKRKITHIKQITHEKHIIKKYETRIKQSRLQIKYLQQQQQLKPNVNKH